VVWTTVFWEGKKLTSWSKITSISSMKIAVVEEVAEVVGLSSDFVVAERECVCVASEQILLKADPDLIYHIIKIVRKTRIWSKNKEKT